MGFIYGTGIGVNTCLAMDGTVCMVNATALEASGLTSSFTRYWYNRSVETHCNLAVSDMYMNVFGKYHQIAYTYCSVGISDLKSLTGTSADQLPHRKSRPLATA